MGTGGHAAIYVSLASLLVSMTTVAWNVVSWRRAGSHLRVHALLYREILLLWVFNAGRISDTVERIEIGGRRGGIGGHPLSTAVNAPFTLAAGESRRFELDWKACVPSSRHGSLNAGLESVWLLLGSMQQKRAEVLALPYRRPPEIGWRLAPRGSNVARYAPLIWTLPLAAICQLGPESPSAAVTLGFLAVFVLGVWVLVTNGFRSLRRKIERRYMILGTVLLCVISVSAPTLTLAGYALALYVVGAFILAMPGWISLGVDSLRHLWRVFTDREVPDELEETAPNTPAP
jgi:hypothetical protein